MSSKIKVTVRLTEASRFGSPVIIFTGKSGKQYQFIWNPEAEKHLLDGKVTDATDWNKIAEDLLDPRDRNRHKVIIEIIGADGEGVDQTELLNAKIKELELAFSQAEEGAVALQSDLLKATQRVTELEAAAANAPTGVSSAELEAANSEIIRLKADNLELSKLVSSSAESEAPAPKKTAAPRKTAAQKKAEAASAQSETPPAAE